MHFSCNRAASCNCFLVVYKKVRQILFALHCVGLAPNGKNQHSRITKLFLASTRQNHVVPQPLTLPSLLSHGASLMPKDLVPKKEPTDLSGEPPAKVWFPFWVELELSVLNPPFCERARTMSSGSGIPTTRLFMIFFMHTNRKIFDHKD